MTERELREALRSVPVEEARARSLAVVRAAYRAGEPVPTRRRWSPALAVVACLLAAVVVAAAVNAPGDAVARWVRDVLGVGQPDARPALVRVPGGGRLLVSSAGGVWVVSADGTRRRLGGFDGASWSPRGLFVVAWRGGELSALEPSGRVRWALARPGRIAVARWAPVDGFRIAYVIGGSLRIVNGDGTGDRRWGRARAVAPAWRPDAAHVLAYVDGRRRVNVVAVDRGRSLWRSPPLRGVRRLAWSADGHRLAIAAGHRLYIVRDGQPKSRRVHADELAWSPDGRLTVVRRSAIGSEVVVGRRVLFSGPGRFGAVAWAPGGRRLLVPWPEADQWLFLDADGGRVAAVANIARQFGGRAFPDAVEWCCPR